ncbi:hypothetical protein [Rhodococcus opacus]|uniref:Uncharacterized protein n=1 Tax=Rhodococcus opacus TaxID=37919 RepID=A0A2S8IW31_RHOOP|nr:hypothetical protein [Rhodococcus opacus]PQP18987.1 hypothetical protein C5613_31280 [Rhodococcus opacus]
MAASRPPKRQARAADPVDRGEGESLRGAAQKLRAELYEVHSLVDPLAFRFPAALDASSKALTRGERT